MKAKQMLSETNVKKENTMNRTHTLAVTLSFLLAATAMASATDLTVTVKDVRNASGAVLIVVYDEGSFGTPEVAKAKQKANANAGEVKFVFHNLPAGKYAVSAFHDENGNGKLDRNSLGVPTEGWGFSNDAQGAGGPPKFSQAAFDFDGKTNKGISFSLNY
jgi:uncharacterized protein (DUF2141 family)